MYYLDTITSTIQGRFESAQEYASAAWAYASQYLGTLSTLIQNFTPEFIDLDFDMEPININDYTPSRPVDFAQLTKDKLEADLEAGGSGLDPDVEQAIYDRAQARQDIINERTYQENLERWSSRGWNIPPGALTGVLQEALLEQTRADAELSKDIMIKQAELVLANDHFIKEAALKYIDSEIKLYEADVHLAGVQIDGQIKSYDIQLQHETNRVTINLKEAEVNLSMVIEAYKIQIEAIRAGASIYAQLAASAMSSVSAAAQMSYRGGYDKNYNESVSRSYSEQHIYHYSE